MKITAVLPVSRLKYLDRVLESLVNQTRQPDNLIVIYDGPKHERSFTYNKVMALPLDVSFFGSNNPSTGKTIPDRRKNIATNHNQLRARLTSDWVFSVEDDGILPIDALERLTSGLTANTGMITGVELGRWGYPYVGAWLADNINDVKSITSVEAKESGVEKIDAAGLYCALIRTDLYKEHTFFYENGLGPDVNLGIFIRQKGFDNFINWDIPVTHLTEFEGVEVEIKGNSPSKPITVNI